MIQSNKLNYSEFSNKYWREWSKGNITQESLDELYYILEDIDISNHIYSVVSHEISRLVSLLVQYRFKKNQHKGLIEPIRESNWALHHWLNIDPNIERYCKVSFWTESSVYEGFRLTYGNDCYVETAGDELIEQVINEFSPFEKLADIDFVEDYLLKYSKTDKIRRYLQKI